MTPIFTATATSTPTFTATSLYTFTPTPVTTPGFSISLPYPNPSYGSFVHWDIQTSEALTIQWSVFNVGDFKLLQETATVNSPTTLVWNLKDRWGNNVPNGIYFVRFKVISASGNTIQIFKVLVLN
jgi:hypothetical protein